MLFYLSKITALFQEPLAVVFLILAAAALLQLSGRQRWAGFGVGAAIAIMTIVIFTPLDFWLLAPLESRFPAPAPPACLDGVIMLGDGEDVLSSDRLGIPQLSGAPMRYVILSDLMRRYPGARVVFAGGSGIFGAHRLTEADVAKGLMNMLGMDVRRVAFESSSRTTWENAVNAKKMVQPKPDERWALLAPAAQLPRAVGVFRKNGWNVLPWPTDYAIGTPVWWPQDVTGRFGAINEGEHEWLGLIVYWIVGRTTELLPKPSSGAGRGAAC
jgi:uncharacterized SAM-binding protein YcdF (DUF218 family)